MTTTKDSSSSSSFNIVDVIKDAPYGDEVQWQGVIAVSLVEPDNTVTTHLVTSSSASVPSIASGGGNGSGTTNVVKKKVKLSKRFVAVSKQCLFILNKKRVAIENKFHLIELEQIENSIDGNIIIHFKRGRLDKERQLHVRQCLVINLEPRNALVAFITRVRKSLRDLTNGFPENYVTISLDPADLEEINKKELLLQTEVAEGFTSTYNAICNLKEMKPDKELIHYIKSLDSNSCRELDLSMWSGLDESPDYIHVFVLALQYNTFFESLVIKNVHVANLSKFVSGIVKHNSRLKKLVIHNTATTWTHELGGSLALNENNKISILDLSSNEMKQNGVAFLANALSKFSHPLTVLNISNMNIASEGFVLLFGALSSNLGLSVCLTELNISKNLTMDDRAIDAFLKWLLEISSKNAELCRLAASDLGLGIGKVAAIVKKLSNLSYLNLSGNRFDSRAESELVSLGKLSKSLRVLCLKKCSLPPDVVKHVMEAVFANSYLSRLHLNFSGNPVGDKGEMIASALSRAKNLEVINLSSMELTLKCGINIIDSLPLGLINIVLDDNFSVEELKTDAEPDGELAVHPLVQNFFKALQKMLEIRPSLTFFSMKGTTKNRLEHQMIAFFKILKNNTSLTFIDVRDQHCGPVAFQKLCRVLLQNTTLQYVKADGNNLSFKSYLQARNVLLHNSTLSSFSVLTPQFDSGSNQPIINDVLTEIFSYNSMKQKGHHSSLPPNLFKFSLNWEAPSVLGTITQIPETEDPKRKGIFSRSKSRVLARKLSVNTEGSTTTKAPSPILSASSQQPQHQAPPPQSTDKVIRSKSQAAVNEKPLASRKTSDPGKMKRKKQSLMDDEEKRKIPLRKNTKRPSEETVGSLSTIEDTPVKSERAEEVSLVLPSSNSLSAAIPPPVDLPPPPPVSNLRASDTVPLPDDLWNIILDSAKEDDLTPVVPASCSFNSGENSFNHLPPLVSCPSIESLDEICPESPQQDDPHDGAAGSETLSASPLHSNYQALTATSLDSNSTEPTGNASPESFHNPHQALRPIRLGRAGQSSTDQLSELGHSPSTAESSSQHDTQQAPSPSPPAVNQLPPLPPTIPPSMMFPFSTAEFGHNMVVPLPHSRPVARDASFYRASVRVPVEAATLSFGAIPSYSNPNNSRQLQRSETCSYPSSAPSPAVPELHRTESAAILCASTNYTSVKNARKAPYVPTSAATMSEKKLQKENKPSDDLDAYLYNLELQQFSTQRTRPQWG